MGEARFVCRFHLVFRLCGEGEHHAVAEARRLAVLRRADIDAVRVAAFGAVADPAAIGEFALMPERAEERVIKLAGRFAVLGADGCVTDHGTPPDNGRGGWPPASNKSRTKDPGQGCAPR